MKKELKMESDFLNIISKAKVKWRQFDKLFIFNPDVSHHFWISIASSNEFELDSSFHFLNTQINF